MKTIITFCIFILLSYHQVFSQTLPNMDFEDWTSYGSGSYEEPSGGVWTTANKSTLLTSLIPVTTEKTTDSYSGVYAAKMTTKLAQLFPNPLLVTGTLATGTFDELAVPPANLKMGTPFTSRPLRFTGYYKYENNNGDSCDIYAILSKWDGTQRVIIGDARLRSTLTVPQYTKFDLSFNYYSQDTPDSISVVFASSAAGDQLIGNSGSTLYIDNTALEYTSGMEENPVSDLQISSSVNPSENNITFKMSRNIVNGNIYIYNELGAEIKSVHHISDHVVSLSGNGLSQGIYFYRLIEKNIVLNTGRFYFN